MPENILPWKNRNTMMFQQLKVIVLQIAYYSLHLEIGHGEDSYLFQPESR